MILCPADCQIIISEGTTAASTVTYLLPVVAITLGATVLNEHLMPPDRAGIALILAGVALMRHHTRRAPEGPTDVPGPPDG
jgi:drug/metabolite transporter (DMT)-like permease